MREEVLPPLDATPARPRRLRHIAGICAALAVVLILAQGYVFVGLRQLLHPLIGGLDNFDLVCDLICEGVCALLCVEALVLLGGWRVLRVRREEFFAELLVPDRAVLAHAFPQVSVERASVDAYLSLYMKGAQL